jgi:hypothetical protein
VIDNHQSASQNTKATVLVAAENLIRLSELVARMAVTRSLGPMRPWPDRTA